ncbi:MAG TPA: ABC transporter permease [Bacteroidales bacterium]|nr:ABC transporter permease [Bacteroidales bacterium]HSA44560.1 ABC transporter permease [Bacteroidales bacterium]
MALSVRKYSGFDLLIIFLSGLVLLFIVAPLLGMLLRTTPGQLFEVSGKPEVMHSIVLTLGVSFSATLVFAVAAVPFAYFLARRTFHGRRLVNGLVDLPIVIPHTAAGIAMLGFISRESVTGKAASLLGLELVGRPAGIALAMAFVSLPFLINAARDGFASVPVRYEKAALNLGASPFRVFITIALPLAWKQILSGLVLMFARGMSEFGAVVIVAYHPMVTPVLVYEWFGAYGLRYARPAAVLFMLIALAFFIVLRLLTHRRHHA